MKVSNPGSVPVTQSTKMFSPTEIQRMRQRISNSGSKRANIKWKKNTNTNTQNVNQPNPKPNHNKWKNLAEQIIKKKPNPIFTLQKPLVPLFNKEGKIISPVNNTKEYRNRLGTEQELIRAVEVERPELAIKLQTSQEQRNKLGFFKFANKNRLKSNIKMIMNNIYTVNQKIAKAKSILSSNY